MMNRFRTIMTGLWMVLVMTAVPAFADDYNIASITSSPVTEGTNLIFTVTLDKAPHDGDVVTIDYATGDGTAKVDDADYVGQSASLVFDGTDTQTITVVTADDSQSEADETVLVHLTSITCNNPDPVLECTVTGADNDTGTIVDNDYEVSTFEDVSFYENAVGGHAILTVGLDKAVQSGTVQFDIIFPGGGTATAGTDYTESAAPTPVEISAPNQSATFSIPITDDSILDNNEYFEVKINAIASPGSVNIPDDTARVTIRDAEYTITPNWSLHGEVELYLNTLDPANKIAISNHTPVTIPNHATAIFRATWLYGFTGYSENIPGDGVEVLTPTEWTYTIDGATIPAISNYLTVNFDHQITMIAGANGSLTRNSPPPDVVVPAETSGTVYADHGSTQGFLIDAADGYCVADVLLNNVSQGGFVTDTNNNRDLDVYSIANVQNNHTLEARFGKAKVTVNLGAADGGTEEDEFIQDHTQSGSGWRVYLTDKFYNVGAGTLIKTGHHGESFSIPEDIPPAIACDARYFVIQFLDVDGWLKPSNKNIDLNKKFNENQVVEGLYDAYQHLLVLSAEHGSITTDPIGTPGTIPNSYYYPTGTSVTLTPVPEIDYFFQGWQTDVTGTTNPLIVTMSQDWNIKAVFIPGCEDGDKDGFKNAGDGSCDPGPAVDCNDADPSVYPGATEICGDGIDQDCAGGDLSCDATHVDNDGDGYTEIRGDCDDTSSAIHPGAYDDPETVIDEDCFDGNKEKGSEITCVTPSDVPAEAARKPAPPSIMFLLDDSGSMDWEFMTPQGNQLFSSRYYVHSYASADDRAYENVSLSTSQRKEWLSQYSGYNRIYFNPTVTYTPWPKWDQVAASIPAAQYDGIEKMTATVNEKKYDTDNTSFPDSAFIDGFVHADMDNPRMNTLDSWKGKAWSYIDDDGGAEHRLDLNAEFFRVKSVGQQVMVARHSGSSPVNGDTRADAIGLSTRGDLQVNQPIASPTPRYTTRTTYPVTATEVPYELSPWAAGAARPDAPEIIFDNQDGTNVYSESGTWAESGGDNWWEWKQGLRFTNYVGAYAKWRLNLTAAQANEYYLYAWIDEYVNSDANAKYTIFYYDGTSLKSEDFFVNQRPEESDPAVPPAEGPRWIKLADKKFPFVEQSATAPDIIVPNAHYFTWHDADGDGERDVGEVYLITIPGSGRTVGSYTLNYYRFNDLNTNDVVEDGELIQLFSPGDDTEIAHIKPKRYTEGNILIDNAAQLAFVVRQDFADWYSFYRRRILTAKAAVGLTVHEMERVSLGVHTINRTYHEPLKYIETKTSPEIIKYLATIYDIRPNGSTYLRRGLYEVGRYFQKGDSVGGVNDYTNLKTSEGRTSASDAGSSNASIFWDAHKDIDSDFIEDSGGACQRAYVIAMTDGYYNEANTTISSWIGNEDLNSVFALKDSTSYALADVAHYFYHTDLAPGLEDDVPAKGFDDATHQHMVTFGVSFGVFGEFDPKSFPDCLPECTPGDVGCPDLDNLGKVSGCTTNGDGDLECYTNTFNAATGEFEASATKSIGPFAGVCPQWHTGLYPDTKKTVDDLYHASVNGRGAFLNAADPAELVAAMKKIKDLIEETEGTSASVSINANKIESNTLMYQTSYNSADWSGDVEAKCLDNMGNIASCAAVQCVTGCGETYDTCINACTVGDETCEKTCTDDHTECLATNNCAGYMTCNASYAQCFTSCGTDAVCKSACAATKQTCEENPPEIKWSASDKLDVKDWSSRSIITSDVNGNGLAFRWSLLTPAMQSSLGNETVLNYLRGDDSCEAGNTTGCIKNYRNRSSKLGDFINSEPYFFKNDDLGISWVMAGANDGMLHILNSDTGEEIFSYIPGMIFPNIDELASATYNDNHKYFVDGYVVAQNLGDEAGDATLMVGGLAKGGKGYFALDLKAATNALAGTGIEDPANAVDIVKWEYNELTQAADPEIGKNLGYSYSRPQIVRSNDKSDGAEWLLVFGNGYDSTNGRAVLFLVGLKKDGSIAWTHMIDTGVGGASPDCNGLSTPALIFPQGDGVNDFAFAGDLLGNLWKFDISDPDRANWGVYFKDSTDGNQPLFQARSNAGYRQPITMQPDVTSSCVNGTEGYLVAFGTGRLLNPEVDNLDTSVQSMYGIWDWSAEWAKIGPPEQAKYKYLGYFMPKDSDVTASCVSTCSAVLGSPTASDTCLFDCLGNSECELECYEVAEECTYHCSSVRNLSNMDEIIGSAAEYVTLLQQTQVSVDGLIFNSDGTLKEQIYGQTDLDVVDKVVRTMSNHETEWLVPSDVDDIADPFIANPAKTVRHVGWYFDFPMNGERAVEDVSIARGKLILTSSIPSDSPCESGGSSYVWVVDACTGSRSNYAIFDINDDGIIDRNDYINIGTESDPIWVSVSAIGEEGLNPAKLPVDVEGDLDKLLGPTEPPTVNIYGLPIKHWRELEWR